MIRELDDEDPVLRHEPDQRDEPHLTVYVQGGEPQEREERRATYRERSGACEDDERITEAIELSGEHEEDENPREQEDVEEPATLRAELARLARIVDGEALGKDPLRF